MMLPSRPLRRIVQLLAIAHVAASFGGIAVLRAAEPPAEFSKPVIDIGVVVGDIDKSAAFYTNAIGFHEIQGFNVPPAMGKKIGLTDGLGVKIRVFELGEGNGATKIKLMAFTDTAPAKPDRRFIHSTFGLNYLTIYVSDMASALKRLKSFGVKLLGESPVELGGGTQLVTFQDPDGTFIELVGPGGKP
jgi:lactoylglutathione lyase